MASNMNSYQVNSAISKSNRLYWIDWMKFIGMYFIILGHFFPPGNKYIYVFNVPLFFIVSGFLCKKEEDNILFLRKIWYNLIVPMLIISLLHLCESFGISIWKGNVDNSSIMTFPVRFAFGMHSAVGACWFVYTLVILRVIQQFFYQSKIYQALLMMFFVLVATFLNKIEFHPGNSILNVCLAYPFYLVGGWIREYKNFFSGKFAFSSLLVVLSIALLAVICCGYIGGGVWMYKNAYGRDFLVFLIGGFWGTIAIFIMSKWLERFYYPMVSTVSKGMIVILGFHMDLMMIIKHYFVGESFLLDPFWSLLILLSFIPIIKVLERYFPLLIGKFRMHS